jgi:hypothetical protein
LRLFSVTFDLIREERKKMMKKMIIRRKEIKKERRSHLSQRLLSSTSEGNVNSINFFRQIRTRRDISSENFRHIQDKADKTYNNVIMQTKDILIIDFSTTAKRIRDRGKKESSQRSRLQIK